MSTTPLEASKSPTKVANSEVDYSLKAEAFANKYKDRIIQWRMHYGDHKPLPITLTPSGEIIWLSRKDRRS